jgi:hypothetical protein
MGKPAHDSARTLKRASTRLYAFLCSKKSTPERRYLRCARCFSNTSWSLPVESAESSISIRPALDYSGNREPGDRSLLSPHQRPMTKHVTTPKLDISELDSGREQYGEHRAKFDTANS